MLSKRDISKLLTSLLPVITLSHWAKLVEETPAVPQATLIPVEGDGCVGAISLQKRTLLQNHDAGRQGLDRTLQHSVLQEPHFVGK